jgi:hypothetical protein
MYRETRFGSLKGWLSPRQSSESPRDLAPIDKTSGAARFFDKMVRDIESDLGGRRDVEGDRQVGFDAPGASLPKLGTLCFPYSRRPPCAPLNSNLQGGVALIYLAKGFALDIPSSRRLREGGE